MGLFPRNSSKGTSNKESPRSPQKRRRDNTLTEQPKSKKAKKDEVAPETASHKLRGLTVGSSVIAVVGNVFKDRLQVDLPQGHRGVVSGTDAHRDSEVSDLRTIYKVGQIVVGVITTCPAPLNGGKKQRDERYGLSLRCELFRQRFTWKVPPAKNQLLVCYISSIEEHGATATLGENSQLRLFIKEDAGLRDLLIGQIVYVTVEAVKKEAKLIVCKFGRESRPRFLAQNADIDSSTLTAGQLVEVKITTCVSGTGVSKKTPTSRLFPDQVERLEVSFCRSMSGYVPKSHLHHPLMKIEDAVPPLEAAYPFKKGLTQTNKRANTWPRQCPRFGRDDIALARVLSVTHHQEETTQVSLSLLPHVVNFHIPQSFVSAFDALSVGTLIEDARVVSAVKENGVRLIAGPLLVDEDEKTNETEDDDVFSQWQLDLDQSMLLCSPKKFVADETPEFAINSLNVGEKKRCRVLNRNFCDATFLVGLGAKAVEAELFCANNLSVGQEVRAEIHKKLDWGFYVKISDNLQAKLKKEQLSDVFMEKVPEKYKEGAHLKLRVLRIDQKANSVQVTAKKSFLKMSAEMLKKQRDPLKEIQLNDHCECFVDKATDRSLLLRGFADFSGLLPFEDIAATLFDDHSNPISMSTRQRILSSKKLRVGATLRVRVNKIKLASDNSLRIVFSLDLDKIADETNGLNGATHIPEKERETSPLLTIDNTTLEQRQRPGLDLPFLIEENETPEMLAQKALAFIPKDSELEGQVRYISSKCQTLDISLWGKLRAVLHATEVADTLPEYPLRDFEVNDIVRVRIKGAAPLPRVTPHLVLLEASLRAEDDPKMPRSVSDLAVGEKYTGVITSVGLPGVYVALSSTVTVRIKRCSLSSPKYDKWLAAAKDPRCVDELTDFFPVGRRLQGVRIVSVSLSVGLAEATLKTDVVARVLGREEGLQVTFESVNVGDTLPAKVKAETSFGLFVTLEGSDRLDALCPKEEIRDDGDETKLESGDLVLVKILSKDDKRRRLRVGLKSSYFDELDLTAAEQAIEPAGVEREASDDCEMDDATSVGNADNDQTVSETDDINSDLHGDETADEEEELSNEVPLSGLTLNNRSWLTESEPVANADGLEDFLRKSLTGKKRATRTRKAETEDTDELAEEKETRQAERDIASGDWEANPQTTDEFERLVLIKPNDPTTWIRYMAHYAELQDRVKAAEIAQRGIDRLDPALSLQRCDIWLAWLNMEYAFGNKADQEALLTRALQYNEPVKVYLHMINLLESFGRWKELDQMTSKMFKKEGTSKDLWIRYLTSLYIRDRKSSELRGALHQQNSSTKDLTTRPQIDDTLTRALKRLPANTHIELRTTAARLEFKYGQPERARGLFASILESAPKRTDVWNILFDAQLMSLKSGKSSPAEILCARQLFMNACSVDFRVGKAKSMYKRWAEFESTWGDTAGLAECRRRAELYVQSQQLAAERAE